MERRERYEVSPSSSCWWSSRSSACWWPCCCRPCRRPAKRPSQLVLEQHQANRPRFEQPRRAAVLPARFDGAIPRHGRAGGEHGAVAETTIWLPPQRKMATAL